MLFLFSDDAVLVERVQPLLDSQGISLTVRKALVGDEGTAVSKQNAIFIVDASAKNRRADALVEGLCRDRPDVGKRTLLIVEGSVNEALIELMKKLQVRGYLLLNNLEQTLLNRLEALLKNDQPDRFHPRLATSLPVAFEVLSLKYTGLCTSFSPGGMFVQTDKAPAVDTPIKATLQLNKQSPPQPLAGKVLYKLPVGFAMSFSTPVPQLYEALLKLTK